MKRTLRQIFHTPQFLVGFIIFMVILLTIIIYPIVVGGDPLQMIGVGTFFKPGTYVSLHDSIGTQTYYTLNLSDAAAKRIDSKLSPDDRVNMKEWLVLFGIPEDEIDIEDTVHLLDLWWNNYSQDIRLKITSAKNKAYIRLDEKLKGLFDSEDYIITQMDPVTGEESKNVRVKDTDYINVKDIANVRFLLLGTDNFGRDMFKELVSAAGTSMRMGLIAGTVATMIGLFFGLLAGYVGGWVDDIIMFILNLFTVIPTFVLLILISYGIAQGQRGPSTVAIIIGVTSWVWTARSVRSQVISLRNRDHVNLSKLSGHSLVRIIATDILPYIASYVVMAFILQISTAILTEAQLSMIGLGPKTTEVATLGLMMNWAMSYVAHIHGAWWAYYPIIILIALISFSFNLMNTGLDQVFNPQLRE